MVFRQKKIDSVDIVINHVTNGVPATSAHTDHFNDGTLWCTVYEFKHDFLPFLKKLHTTEPAIKLIKNVAPTTL
jgi:hypothetical protein